MSDLATQGPPTTAEEVPVPRTPGQQLGDSLTTATRAAPELRTNPGAAVAVAQNGGDVAGNAQVVAHVANAQAIQKAHQAQLATTSPDTLHSILGFFSHTVSEAVKTTKEVGGDIGQGLNYAGHLANAPLNYVQHEYRYLHDVVARHGALAGVLEGIGIAAGAVALGIATGGVGDLALAGALGAEGVGAGLLGAAGTALGAGSGAVLGGEAAAGIEGHLAYKDSWARTANGATYRDPNSQQPVSLGRDAASALGLRPGTGSYRFVSGVGDAIGDLSLDPLGHVGRIIGQARSAEGAHGLLGTRFSGLAPQSAEDVQRVYDQYPSVRNAFRAIAAIPADQASRILEIDPRLATGPNDEIDHFLLNRLGRASTPEEVTQVFAEAIRTHELTMTATLPTLTTTRELAMNAADRIANSASPLAQRVSRAVRKVPMVYDPALDGFTREEFSPADNYGVNAVYKMGLYAETPEVARSMASAYLNAPTVNQRITIYRNAVLNTLQAMVRNQGVDFDEEDARQIGSRLDALVKASAPVHGGVYGMDATGQDISKVADALNGSAHSAAITENQIGKLALPDFTAMKRVATVIARAKKMGVEDIQDARDSLSGRLDDWMYDHITQGIFKRLVLLSGGFAMRVALSEDIPNTLRLGLHNLVRNRLAASGAKDLSNQEVEDTSHWLWNMLGTATLREQRNAIIRATSTAADRFDPGRVYFYSKMGETFGGPWVSHGVGAEHNLADELAGPVESAQRSLTRAVDRAPDKLKPTDEFTTRDQHSEQEAFIPAWQRELAENSKSQMGQLAAKTYLEKLRAGQIPAQGQMAAQREVTDWLDHQPESWLGQYERHTLKSVGADPGLTPHQDWARILVRKVLGSVTGDDGTVHDDLLARIANGGKFDKADLASRDRASWPTQVKDRIYSEVHAAPLERLANVGFRRVLNPMINWLSREPFYTEEAYRQWRILAPQVERGELNEDQAMTLAMSRATNKAIRFVHNLNERTQASSTLRNWAPFYFAQEQAYKRVFRLLAEDPGAFRRYQMMLGAVHNIGAQTKGPDGQNYYVYPGTGWLSEGAIAGLGHLGIPVLGSNVTSYSANLSSAGVMFPFAEGVRPDVGPVVALPVKAISDLFESRLPWVAPAESGVLGGITANEPFWQAAIPNTALQRIGDLIAPTLTSGDQGTVSFNSTFMHTLQALAYEGHLPPENAGPVEQQDFLNRVRNQTMINYGVRALLGLIVPISPQVQVKDWGLSAQVQAEIDKAGNASTGIANFLAKHPDATPYTVFESTGKTGGYLPDTKAALDWIEQNRALVEKYPYAAAWLMPASASKGPYDAAAYNEQIAMGLRQRRMPQDFLNQLYVAAGNRQYYDVDRPAYYQMLLESAGMPSSVAAMAAKKGLTSSEISQAKSMGNPTALDNAWTAYQTQYQKMHPIWADDFNSNTSATRRTQTISELQEVYAKGYQPKTPQGAQLGALLKAYDEYDAAHQAGLSNDWADYTATDLKDAWQAYLTKTATDFPLLAGVIQSIFLSAT